MKPDDILSVLRQPLDRLVDLCGKLENYASRYFATVDLSAKLFDYQRLATAQRINVPANLARRKILITYSGASIPWGDTLTITCFLGGSPCLKLENIVAENFAVDTYSSGTGDFQAAICIEFPCYCDSIQVDTSITTNIQSGSITSEPYRA